MASLFVCDSTALRPQVLRPQLKRDPLGSTDPGDRFCPMIRRLPSGKYRLYSLHKDPKTGKRRNLGTFPTRAAAEKHEREVEFFKRRGREGAA